MSDWQPIETAPKDGTVILLGDNRYAKPAYLMAEWDRDYEYWMTKTSSRGHFQFWRDATHWMPLPEPPK